MSSLARWCFHHRKLVLACWLLALVVALGLDLAIGATYSTRFQLGHTDSAKAQAILQKDFPTASGDSDQIVFQARTGTLRSPAVEAPAAAMLAKVATLPHVVGVASPFAPGGQRQISADGTIGFATVQFDQQAQDLPRATVEKVISTAKSARSAALQVELNGAAIENVEPVTSSRDVGLGVFFALVVLAFVFGSLLSAVIPVVTALVAIGIGFAVTGLMSHVIEIASFVPILGVLIGLGVGVDYALFIITRHRAGLRGGRGIEDAAVTAVNTAGRAVFFAGLTVCIALLGQFALGISFLYGLAISASVTVGLTMLASLTLLPALLGFFDVRVLSRRERRRMAAAGPTSERVTAGFWHRWSRQVQRHPGILALVAFLFVVVVALPIFSLRLGLTDAGTDPPATTTRQAYDLIAKGFGPGFSGPLSLVTTLPDGPASLPAFERVIEATGRTPGVVAVTPPRVSPNGRSAVALAYPAYGPSTKQTSALLRTVRTSVIPPAAAGTGLHVYVGGVTASQVDFSRVLASKLWLFITVVVVVAFLLLMVVFRSLLIPAIASIMNLLSVGAALGIMNAMFNLGWGGSLLGFKGSVPVEVFVPVIMFSVLFGLSMDYEVFLVSRMHEEWAVSGDNTTAVTTGQAETGRVITAAALIMILVFLSFLLGGEVIISQFGVGLAGAIIIDAFVVRTVLVPALMHLTGPRNWWLPRWLDRWLPHLHMHVPDHPPTGELPALVP